MRRNKVSNQRRSRKRGSVRIRAPFYPTIEKCPLCGKAAYVAGSTFRGYDVYYYCLDSHYSAFFDKGKSVEPPGYPRGFPKSLQRFIKYSKIAGKTVAWYPVGDQSALLLGVKPVSSRGKNPVLKWRATNYVTGSYTNFDSIAEAMRFTQGSFERVSKRLAADLKL